MTITGAGGIGKTQTALRAATTIAEGRNGGVHFVGLGNSERGGAVVAAIAAALGVREAPNGATSRFGAYASAEIGTC